MVWVLIAVLGLALGFATALIRSKRFLFAALTLAIVLPLLVVFGAGIFQGCALRVGGEECMGYGFGMAMTIGLSPLWILLIAAGYWIKRLMLGATR